MELRRPPEAAPTEPGLFYGRYLKDGPQQNQRGDITPIRVYWSHFGPRVLFAAGASGPRMTASFEWFGLVPQCVASGEKS